MNIAIPEKTFWNRLRREWLALIVLSLPLVFLLATVRPDVEGGDSAELIAAAHCVGIPHATGYPLYMWLGRIALTVPGLDAATAMNGMSALFGAAALILFAFAIREWTGNLLVGAIAVAGLAVARPFWYVATLAEVYTLHHFLLAATFFLLFRWRRTGDARLFLLAIYSAAMNGAHHGGAFLFAPGYVIFVLTAPSKIPPLRTLLPGMLLVPLALTVYLHLPVRHAETPPIDAFVDIENKVKWGLISEELAGTTFTDRFRYKLEGSGPRRKLSWFGEAADKNAPLFLPYFRNSLGALFLGLGLAGLMRALIAGPRACGFLLLYCLVFNTLFYLNFLSHDIEDFLVPSLLLLSVGTGILLGDLRRLIGTAGLRGAAATLIMLILFTLNIRGILGKESLEKTFHHTSDFIARERGILAYDFPEGARILIPWGRAEAMRYLQVVEGIRRDLQIHPMGRQNFLRVALQIAPEGPLFVEDATQEMRRHFHITSRGGLFELREVDRAGKAVD